MAEHYKVIQIIVIGQTNVTSFSWERYKEILVITETKVFQFTDIDIAKRMISNPEEYSVKVWKSTSRRHKGTTLMELSKIINYRRRPARAGNSINKRPLNEIPLEQLPELKERIVMQLI